MYAPLMQPLLLMAVAFVGGVVGCGGGSANSTTIPTQGGVGTVEQGSPQLSGLVQTADASLSADGRLVTLEEATIVVNDAQGGRVGQGQSTREGYFITVPQAGVYTIVPMPFKVGNVTLTALTQQVTVGPTQNARVNITYQRQQ